MEQSARLDLNQLYTFWQVAQSGSFAKAAKALGIPRSTASRQIAALELRLGTRLIERTTRRMALTEIGQICLTHCERAIAEAQEAERAAAAHSLAPRGLLRVGAPVTFSRVFLAPVVSAFCRKYPEVKIELVIRGERLDPVEKLLDLVIHVGRPQDSTYVTRKLGALPQGLFASKAYLKARAAPKTPADLATHDLIALSRSGSGATWQLTSDSGRKLEVRVDPRLAVNDPVLLHRFAADDAGIAAIPEFMAHGDRSLRRVLPQWTPHPVEFFALYPARRYSPPKLRVFLEELGQLRIS